MKKRKAKEITKFVRIIGVSSPISWWNNIMGDVVEVVEYIPKTDFYRIKTDLTFESWGGIPAEYCEPHLKRIK